LKGKKDMKNNTYQQEKFDDYWKKFYNKLERIIGWLIFTVGIVIIISYGLFKIFESIIVEKEMSIILKVGLFSVIAGMVFLLFSVIREKITLKKIDKYKEIDR